jgi:hypothetical protein
MARPAPTAPPPRPIAPVPRIWPARTILPGPTSTARPAGQTACQGRNGCNATAFSPTDVMPLARWAKLTMAAQSGVSLAVVVLVVARAVNLG